MCSMCWRPDLVSTSGLGSFMVSGGAMRWLREGGMARCTTAAWTCYDGSGCHTSRHDGVLGSQCICYGLAWIHGGPESKCADSGSSMWGLLEALCGVG